MADYCCAYRTSYFRVLDEAKFETLFADLHGESLEDLSKLKAGEIWHAFGGYNSLWYKDEPNARTFFDELSNIIKKSDCCTYMESGNMGIREIRGDIVVVTYAHVDEGSLEYLERNILRKRHIDPQNAGDFGR